MQNTSHLLIFAVDTGSAVLLNEDIPKTTFLMRYGLYKWVIMPMGLTNAPATFMRTMNNLFSDMLDSGMAVFLDNILVYSGMVDENFTLLEQVLACLHVSIHSTVSLRSVASYATVQHSLASMSHLKACTSVTQRYKV